MSGRNGLVVGALAAAVLIATASESLAGRRHRSRGCSSCQTSCSTCTVAGTCDTETASINNITSEAPPAVAKAETQQPSAAKAEAKQPSEPVVVEGQPSRNYYASRRGRWRWRR